MVAVLGFPLPGPLWLVFGLLPRPAEPKREVVPGRAPSTSQPSLAIASCYTPRNTQRGDREARSLMGVQGEGETTAGGDLSGWVQPPLAGFLVGANGRILSFSEGSFDVWFGSSLFEWFCKRERKNATKITKTTT